MCNVLSCVYPDAQAGRRHAVRIGRIFPIGSGMLTELSRDAIAFEGEYDFNYLVYKGKGMFRFGCRRQESGRWRLYVTFRGTWAADFEVLAECSESGGYCAYEGADGHGVRSRVTLSFTTAFGRSISLDVDRPGWSVPTLYFVPD